MNDSKMELETLKSLQSKLELIVNKENEWYKKITEKITKIKETN